MPSGGMPSGTFLDGGMPGGGMLIGRLATPTCAALALSASLKKNIAFRKAGDSGALGAFADRSGGVSGRVLFGTRCLCQSGSADGFG